MSRKPKATTSQSLPEAIETIQHGIAALQGLSPFNGPMKLPSGGFDTVIVGLEVQLATVKQAAVGIEKMIDAVKWQRDFVNHFKK